MTLDNALIAAGTKYQKELLTAPLLALSPILPHFNLRTGVQGKVVGGQLETTGEFIPYKTAKNPTDGTTIVAREWETYLGDMLKEFDPHVVLGTLYTERTASKPNEMEIARMVAMRVMEQAGKGLYNTLFTAVRNAAGTTGADLYNGFSTIFAAAVSGGQASAAKGNYIDASATPIDDTNCGDVLREIWEGGLDELLKENNVRLYCAPALLNAYKRWFQVEFGHVPWNSGYERRELFCSDGRCEFVPLSNMSGQDYIYFTVRENMMIGVDQESDTETLEIRRCDNPKLVQMYAKTYFGTGIDTLIKELFCGVKVDF
jgi:hypothetical protein